MAQAQDDEEAAAAAATEELQIGAKLREWRKAAGLTLNQMQYTSRLSIGYISQVERGMANPSLETLKRLADVLGHKMAELFVDDSNSLTPWRYAVTRRGQRKTVQFPGSGIVNELLSPDLRHQMEIIWVEAPVGATSGGHPHAHDGEECGVVLAGEMIFWVAGDQVALAPGDSIYLDSTLPHRWLAGGVEDLRAIWLISPPTF